jgi:peptidoglycan/LPS O-acetylase OafA/YrhL
LERPFARELKEEQPMAAPSSNNKLSSKSAPTSAAAPSASVALPSAIAPRSARLLGLDLLRLLAIVMVIGRHMEEPPDYLQFWSFWDAWHRSGGLGVDLFFVLSGFLVSGLLFGEYKKHGNISVQRFYVRRAWKIYPAFYFLIAFAYVYQRYFIGFKIRKYTLLPELFFVQNYFGGFWNHTWTLAVEEHFYLILPLLLLFMVWRNRGGKDPFRAVPYVVGGAMAVFLSVRIINYLVRTDYSYYSHVFPTHLRIDALFFGVALAYFFHFHSERFRQVCHPLRYLLVALGVCMIESSLFMGGWSFYYHTFGFMQFYIGAAAILAGVLMCEIPHNRLTLWLGALGAYSYSIYLWHMALMYWAMPSLKKLGIPWGLRTEIYMLGAFVIGITMAKLLELPTLRFRDRIFPSRSGTLVLLASEAAGPSATATIEPTKQETPRRRAA